MASSYFLASTLCFLVLFHACLAQIEQITSRHQWDQPQPPQKQLQQHRHMYRRECALRRLNTLEPTRRVDSEAGETEFWDQSEEQIGCAGVTVLRHTIRRRGLLLPHYTNTPKLVYVVQGRGIQGAVIPGCPETYQSGSESQSQSRRERGEGFRGDQHQKIRRVHEGDVFGLPAGVAEWIYNNGDSELVLFSVHYTSHGANQLDENLRSFFLAGNPQEEIQIGGQRQSHGQRGSRERGQEERGHEERGQEERGQHEQGREERERRGQHEERGCEERGRHEERGCEERGRHEERGREERGRHERGQQETNGNIFDGFDEEILAEAFNIDTELVRRIQSERRDERGIIIRVDRELKLLTPESEEEERQEPEPEERHREEGRGRANGLEETLCTLKLKHSIGDPSQADIYNPRGGRITTANSLNLPILRYIQLSAERGILHQNAIMAPHWNINAHSLMYVTRGNGRVQIVGDNGDTVFDDRVNKGELLVIPQNFAVMKRAGKEGLEWVSIKTIDNAKISQLAGRVSALRAIPAEVLVNSYRISREDVHRLKFNREEITVLPPRSRQSHGRD